MDVDLLISLVFSKPPVWDVRDRKHRNRHFVDKCWREISDEMKEDENKLRKKWKYLRDQFSFLHTKISRSRSVATSETKWLYYEPLMFLKDVVKTKKPQGKLRKSVKRPSNSTSVQQSDYSMDAQENSNYYQNDAQNPLDDTHDANDNDIEIETSYEQEKNTKDTKQNIKLLRANNTISNEKETNSFIENLLNIEKKKLEYLELRTRKNEDNEHLLFFKSLLPHIRKIPQERLLSFRNDIHKIVDSYAYQSKSPS